MRNLDVKTLRELFRHLAAFESFYEATGQDYLVNDGDEYSLWDIKKLFEYGQENLPRRQKQAIYLCLYDNILEKDAAIMMGVSPNNPVMMYSSRGCQHIIEDLKAGKISGIRWEE